MDFLNAGGLRFPVIAALPAAASYTGRVFEQGSKLWFSNGTTWLELTAAASGPANMMTTDTAQTVTGVKTVNRGTNTAGAQYDFGLANGVHTLTQFARLSAGAYSPSIAADDKGLIYAAGSSGAAAGFTIAPWGTSPLGSLHLATSGSNSIYGNLAVTQALNAVGVTSDTNPITAINGAAFVRTYSTGYAYAAVDQAATPNRFEWGNSWGSANDGIAWIYNRANQDIVFGTNNTERGRMKAGGSFQWSGGGIVAVNSATSGDLNPLELSSSAKTTAGLTAATYRMYNLGSPGYTPGFTIYQYPNSGGAIPRLRIADDGGFDFLDATATQRFRIGTTGGVSPSGSAAGYFFPDRTTPANVWALYADAGTARLNYGPTGDRWTTDSSGNFTAVGELRSTFANALRMVQGSYGAMLRQDGSNVYLLFTASGDQYGTWNSLRPLTINLSTGNVQHANGLTVDGGVYAQSGGLTTKGRFFVTDGPNIATPAGKVAGIYYMSAAVGDFACLFSYDYTTPAYKNLRFEASDFAFAPSGVVKASIDASGNMTARDFMASRGDGTGVIFLNSGNTRYLYWDGTYYTFPSADIVCNGGKVGSILTPGNNAGAYISGNGTGLQFNGPSYFNPGGNMYQLSANAGMWVRMPRIFTSDPGSGHHAAGDILIA